MDKYDRALGSLLGMFIGDAFWAQTEFDREKEAITMRGGDADTDATIYGMLAGAIDGASAIPERWIEALDALKICLVKKRIDIGALAKKLAQGLLMLH